jgi:hypothetical protein
MAGLIKTNFYFNPYDMIYYFLGYKFSCRSIPGGTSSLRLSVAIPAPLESPKGARRESERVEPVHPVAPVAPVLVALPGAPGFISASGNAYSNYVYWNEDLKKWEAELAGPVL